MEDRDHREDGPPTPARAGLEGTEGEAPATPEASDTGPADPSVENHDAGRRPTPVRLAMEGVEEDGDEREEASRVIEDPESGTEWLVTLGGLTASGILPLRTVPIMEVNFSRLQEPHQPVRSTLRAGKNLSQLTDNELLEALARSEPYQEPGKGPEGKGSEGKGGEGGGGGRRSRRP